MAKEVQSWLAVGVYWLRSQPGFVTRPPWFLPYVVGVVQLLSRVQLFEIPINCSMPGFPILHCFLEFSQTRPLSQWCHPTVSSFVLPFFSCPQSFPTSVSFPVSLLFASGGQTIRASASASVFLMNIQGWFHLWLTGLVSLLSKELSAFFMAQPSRPYMTTGEIKALTIWTFVSKVMSLLFNTLSV